MKILILTTVYPRGVTDLYSKIIYGKFVKDFAKEWHIAGDEIHVLTPHSLNTKSFEKLDGVFVHRFHYFFIEKWETLTYGDGIPQNLQKVKNKMLVPFFIMAFLLNGVRLVKKYNIDLVNAHWAIPNGYIANWIKIITNVKVVTTVYGAELFPIIAGKMQFLKPFIKKALLKANMVAGISQKTVEAAIRLSGRENISIIPDGIDIDLYSPGSKNLRLLEKYNCENKIVILFTGRMVERKGHRYLLEAMKNIKEKCPKVKLILGGDGPLFKDLFLLREKMHLQNIVELPGFLPEDEMVSLIQSADIYVLPSCVDKNGDTEGSATAALEAMSCGIPVVISYVGGNIGAIENGIGGYYCKAEDSHDISKKVIKILFNSDNRMSKSARDHIVSKYSWDKIILQYKKLINSSW